ncbi:hypothetical protein [Deinococcus radiophilus]|uniref:DoxX family membrane protein n=1 Tax=Deinococcus radiophilus TaxID=32062 RepID=A0A3S0KDU0_9DEIO|nr:hypothetical protein [Deinococcus radiophilus]RTR28317.1 hypothetical protein EJ104_05235 [Deinococcus radiophilus]
MHKSWPPLLPTGSGDTLFDWTLAALLLVIALVAGTAWTAFQRKVSSQHVPVLSGLLRFFLAYSLLSYGLIKFNFGQFGLLNDWQLTATYGESSPMGLLWRFMATSPGYQWLAGVAEVLPALLLLHRRTVTLGALLAAVTMTNVLALNLFFDVPVKLFSAHLLLTALVLAAADLPRLWAFAQGKAVAALPSTLQPALWRWGSWLPTVLILAGVGIHAQRGLSELADQRTETQGTPSLLKSRGFHLVSPKPFNR